MAPLWQVGNWSAAPSKLPSLVPSSSGTHMNKHTGAEESDGLFCFIDSGLLIRVKQPVLCVCVYVREWLHAQ